ncbi:hypothetical protein BDV96DRAFT_654172 [Lophiotrema nucula]|uniref:F-box domain-containing protein n=1 Tax=Lophiotrema nucula TaxID=690887 RepID=A0A6A5YK24_9PLEO|nr:hypothetical protein BDV96DRAFT_654172 [Lophiotrema nucula]
MRFSLCIWAALVACALAAPDVSGDSLKHVERAELRLPAEVAANAAISRRDADTTETINQEPEPPGSGEVDDASCLSLDSSVVEAHSNLTARATKYKHAFELRTKIGRYNQMTDPYYNRDALFKWMSDNLMQLITESGKEYSKGSQKLAVEITHLTGDHDDSWAFDYLNIWIDAGWWGKNMDLAKLMVEVIANAARYSTNDLANCKNTRGSYPWRIQGDCEEWEVISDWELSELICPRHAPFYERLTALPREVRDMIYEAGLEELPRDIVFKARRNDKLFRKHPSIPAFCFITRQVHQESVSLLLREFRCIVGMAMGVRLVRRFVRYLPLNDRFSDIRHLCFESDTENVKSLLKCCKSLRYLKMDFNLCSMVMKEDIGMFQLRPSDAVAKEGLPLDLILGYEHLVGLILRCRTAWLYSRELGCSKQEVFRPYVAVEKTFFGVRPKHRTHLGVRIAPRDIQWHLLCVVNDYKGALQNSATDALNCNALATIYFNAVAVEEDTLRVTGDPDQTLHDLANWFRNAFLERNAQTVQVDVNIEPYFDFRLGV